MLAVIVTKASFVQWGAVVDDQQVALLVFVRIAKLRLRDLVSRILQKILGSAQNGADVQPHALSAALNGMVALGRSEPF